MSADMSPILIIGAGPTGLSLAIALRQRGARVIVIDRQPHGANTSRAAVIHAYPAGPRTTWRHGKIA